MTVLDVERLIAELSAAIPRVRTYLEKRRRDPAAGAMLDPYVRYAWLTSRDTLEALLERTSDPAMPYLASWVFSLAMGRVHQGAENTNLITRDRPLLIVELPQPARISLREAVRRLVSTREREVRDALASVVLAFAPKIANDARDLWSRRGEVAARNRTTAEGPYPVFQAVSALDGLSRSVLTSTSDITRSLLGDAGPSWHDALVLGADLESETPWPRHLSTTVLHNWFGGEAGWLDVPPVVGALPTLLNGASVTRMLARFGARWADAAVPRSLALPLATLPTGLVRMTIGALFGGLLLDRVFLARIVGLSRGEIDRTIRAQAGVVLMSWRLLAMRCLMRAPALSGEARLVRNTAGDLLSETLQRDAPTELGLVLPRLHMSDPARFAALGLAASLTHELRDHFDEDWFRNPRAVHELRDRLSVAPALHASVDEVNAGMKILVSALHEKLA